MRPCVCFCRPALAPCLPAGVVCASRSSPDRSWQLCALASEAVGRLSGAILRCGTLLVPEAGYSPLWQAEQVVAYGLGSRSTLTLSSMGSHTLLCVQRSVISLSGRNIEAQELPLPRDWMPFSPQEQLLLAGVHLLCDELP